MRNEPIRAKANWSGAALAALLAVTPLRAQQAPVPVTLTAEQDHALMMKTLGITSLRPPANGMDPKDPHFANYDEAKANPYPKLPDPLVSKDGRAVATARAWWNVRPEIMED